jgi:hypothetical protein
MAINLMDDANSTINEEALLSVNAVNGVLANDSPSLTVSEVNGSSADVGNPITLASGATLTLNADGSYVYDPSTITNIENTAVGTLPDSFTYTATDGESSAQATVNITVNIPAEPVDAQNDIGATVDEKTALVVPAAGVLANDNVGSDDAVHVSAVNGSAVDIGNPITLPSGATLTLNADGSYVYDPSTITNIDHAPAGTVPDSFTYTAMDGHGDVADATVDITVNVVNDAPVAVDDSASTSEDTAVVTGNVLANDSDVDSTLTPANISAFDATSANGGTVTSNGDGTFSYTPAADFNGADSFSYTIDDGSGGTDSATVAIDVAAVNDAPVAVDDSGSMTEDDASKLFDVRSNDTLDPDAGASNNVAVFEPTVGANGLGIDGTDLAVGVNGNQLNVHLLGTDWQKLAAGQTLDVTSPYGLFGNGIGDASGATLTVTVTGVNDAPVAADDSASTNKNTAVTTGNVLANDTDVDNTLTPANISAFDATSANGGTVASNGDGTFTYTPASGFSGADSFTYTIDDGAGGVDTATVNITVNADNNNHHHHHHKHHDHGHHNHHEHGHDQCNSHDDHHQHQYAEHHERHGGHHEQGGHGSGWLWQLGGSGHHDISGHQDIFAHMPAEIGGNHGGPSNSHGASNMSNHSMHHDGHGSMGGAALAMAQLEHGSMHHNFH